MPIMRATPVAGVRATDTATDTATNTATVRATDTVPATGTATALVEAARVTGVTERSPDRAPGSAIGFSSWIARCPCGNAVSVRRRSPFPTGPALLRTEPSTRARRAGSGRCTAGTWTLVLIAG